MSKELSIIVPFRPTPQQRPRIFKRKGRVMSFDPSAKTKKAFLAEVEEALPDDFETYESACMMNLKFNFKRPKAHYGTGRNKGIRKPSAPLQHIQTPDIDNLIKFVLDALNKTVFVDDKLIVYINAIKYWADEDSIELTIREVNCD